LKKDCPDGFALRDLSEALDNHPQWRKYISDQDLFPTDKMKLSPVLKLLEFRRHMKNESEPKLKALYEFLDRTADFFNAMEDEDFSVDDRKVCFLRSWKYFAKLQAFCPENLNPSDVYRKKKKNINGLSENLFFQIKTTLFSLQRLNKINVTHYGAEIGHPSHLGTNVCELFFSLIRHKVRFPSFHLSFANISLVQDRYPNLHQYAIAYQHAWIEFVKKHAVDCPFSYPNFSTSQYYNDTSGLETSMADIKLTTATEKAAFYEQQRSLHSSSDRARRKSDRTLCYALAKEFSPRRGVMLQREANEKENPSKKRKGTKAGSLFWCDVHSCTKMSPYR
jgi:hypothetical protein